ncbi:MAG TPA: efflux RND transporter periplasmic adaptor subunit [Candidatus Sulfotelmatobacter sp.]|nr:efflux RND transporter periplasmic adaptor subunit [Candidatus Sulfotelmatobacter sp.]
MAKRWKLWVLSGTVFVGLVAAAFQPWEKAIMVRTVLLRRGDMEVTISATATGTVQSESEVQIRAEVPGRVDQVLADEGDRVEGGQLLLRLDRREAQANVELAQANVAAARARLAQATAGVSMLDEQIRTRIEETRATRERARKDLERMRALFDEGAISRQQLDLAEADFRVTQATLEAAQANRDQRAVKDREVEAARAAVKQAEAAAAAAEVQLRRMDLRSPVTGLVTRRYVNPGDALGLGGVGTITLGGPLFTVVDTSRLYVGATIDEVDAGRLRMGQGAVVSFDAHPGETFRGRVSRIAPSVSTEKQEGRTVAIRITLGEEHGLLKPGMSADVRVIVARLSGVLSVPAQAILERDGAKQVYRVEGGRARLHPIEGGQGTWNLVEVRRGLDEGDAVVVPADTPGLRDGVPVRAEHASHP